MQAPGLQLSRAEWAVLGFTVAYVVAFSGWFLMRGNLEFVIYVSTMLLLMWLVGRNLRQAAFPTPMLWALSLWGLAHMAGGGIPVNGSVLYSLKLWDLVGDGELTLLKYDQVVHAYGFGVAAWLLWHLLVRHFPQTRGSKLAFALPAFAAMGLGSLNEIIEFSAVLMVAETNVGGYYNTAIDLVMNAAGAVLTMVIVYLVDPDAPPRAG